MCQCLSADRVESHLSTKLLNGSRIIASVDVQFTECQMRQRQLWRKPESFVDFALGNGVETLAQQHAPKEKVSGCGVRPHSVQARKCLKRLRIALGHGVAKAAAIDGVDVPDR